MYILNKWIDVAIPLRAPPQHMDRVFDSESNHDPSYHTDSG